MQPTTPFEHRHAAHCESGVMSSLLSHHGAPVSEAAAFGLASALSFAFLPFIKVNGFPIVAYRMPPRAVVKGLRKPFGARLRFETFRDARAGEQRLDELLSQGRLVGAQTSVYWLPYFPEAMRFHFNAHNLLVVGRDGDDYVISDPVGEEPVRCARADLARARFAKGALAPKGLLYTLESLTQPQPTPQAWRRAIARNARQMLAPFPLVGVRGIRTLARSVSRLDPQAEHSLGWIGNVVRMQEEIGTGGEASASSTRPSCRRRPRLPSGRRWPSRRRRCWRSVTAGVPSR